MSSTINDTRPPVIHHEHSSWPQRYGTFMVVAGIHVAAGMGLLAMHLRAPSAAEPPVLNVQWVPTQQTAPKPEKPQEKPKEPPKKKPEPTQKQAPVPQQKAVETPLIQAAATAPAAAEAPQTPPAPPAPPQPAPAPQQVAQVAPPIDPNLKPSVDCTQSPISYPEASKKLGEEGTVILRMQVDERGHPLRVEVEKGSGYQRLDRSARETISSSWVCPLRQGRQGYTGWLRVPVKFELSLN